MSDDLLKENEIDEMRAKGICNFVDDNLHAHKIIAAYPAVKGCYEFKQSFIEQWVNNPNAKVMVEIESPSENFSAHMEYQINRTTHLKVDDNNCILWGVEKESKPPLCDFDEVLKRKAWEIIGNADGDTGLLSVLLEFVKSKEAFEYWLTSSEMKKIMTQSVNFGMILYREKDSDTLVKTIREKFDRWYAENVLK